MNRKEAKRILSQTLGQFRSRSYAELVQMINVEPVVEDRIGPGGRKYQIEIQIFWDDKTGGDIRVMGSVDDGGLRAFIPLSVDFIKSPADEFIGE